MYIGGVLWKYSSSSSISTRVFISPVAADAGTTAALGAITAIYIVIIKDNNNIINNNHNNEDETIK